MATPVLSALRKAYPEAEITAMSRISSCELLEGDPDIDELFCFRRAGIFVRHSERRNIIEKLRGGKYDLGILLTNSFSSAWWFWQGKVKYRLGYDGRGRGMFLTHNPPFPEKKKQQHLVHTYLDLLAPLGINTKGFSPRLYLQPKEIEDAKSVLHTYGIRENHKIVGINPGAAYGSAKCWLPERFKEVAQKLLKDPDVYILFFGDQVSAPLVKEICSGLSERVINLAGVTSLRQLSCLIRICDVLLTNDSGPMHMASALHTPLVALFGSTNEVLTGPYNGGHVIHKHVDCSPCYQRTCPIDFRCMKSITVEEVYERIYKILENKNARLRVL